MFARPSAYLACKRPISRLLIRPQNQAFPPLALPRRFSSNAHLRQNNTDEPTDDALDSKKQRRRSNRLPAAPTSLRRVAVEAQRSKDGFLSKALLKEQGLYRTKVGAIDNFTKSLWLTLLLFIDSDCLRRGRTIQYSPSQRHLARKRIRTRSFGDEALSTSCSRSDTYRLYTTRYKSFQHRFTIRRSGRCLCVSLRYGRGVVASRGIHVFFGNTNSLARGRGRSCR